MTSNVLPSPSIQMARSLNHSKIQVPDSIIQCNSYELYIYQMECGNTESAVDAMKRLYVVCLLMGTNFTIQTILPYLTNIITMSQQQSISSSSNAAATAAASTTTAGTDTTTSLQSTTTSTSSSTTSTTPTPGMYVAASILSDEMLLILGQQLLLILKQQQHDTSSNNSNSNTNMIEMMIHYLVLIERLCCVEETVVRDQAIIVAQYICNAMTEYATTNSTSNTTNSNDVLLLNKAISSWMNVIQHLHTADWFTAKVSCAGIVPYVLQLTNCTTTSNNSTTVQQPTSQQIQLITIYRDLCNDETPMVRRAAAKYLGFVIKYMIHIFSFNTNTTTNTTTDTSNNNNNNNTNHMIIENFMIQQIINLTHDEQDSVRLLAIASFRQIGSISNSIAKSNHNNITQYMIQYWIPIIRDCATDLSWRVRNSLAKNFSDIANVIGIQGNNNDTNSTYSNEQNIIMSCFVAVLTDTEAEVRTAAVTHLSRMIVWGGNQLYTTHIQSLLPSLADDVVMDVRSKCALALMDTASISVSTHTLDDITIVTHFGPLYEGFLQDEFHEVQLQVLCNLHKIAHLLPKLAGVVTSLLQMSKAANWRVREAVARLLPHLAEARGIDFFHTVLLEPTWLTLLLDPVASVRNSIVSGMALLVQTVGHEYISNTLLPHHIRIYNQNNNTYLIRTTILNAHVETALACQSGQLWQEVIVQILRGLVDKVPNVRTIAAKGLSNIIKSYNEYGYGDHATIHTQILPVLQKCVSEETDVDCLPACQDALDQIKV